MPFLLELDVATADILEHSEDNEGCPVATTTAGQNDIQKEGSGIQIPAQSTQHESFCVWAAGDMDILCAWF